MGFIGPTSEQIKQFASLPDHGPIVMLNLLKFKPEGGQESYARYGEASTKIINDLGGRVLYFGRYEMPFIGQEDWDAVILVEYPSRAAFLNMLRDENYQEAGRFRTEALLDSRLFATRPESGLS